MLHWGFPQKKGKCVYIYKREFIGLAYTIRNLVAHRWLPAGWRAAQSKELEVLEQQGPVMKYHVEFKELETSHRTTGPKSVSKD